MDYMKEYEKWLRSPALDREQRAELEDIEGNSGEIEERFYAPLAFGTAGLRGITGMGTNRMNVFVVRQATQAIADMICGLGEDAKRRGIAIAYDPRHFSYEFAEAAAGVCAAAGITVYFFEDIRPTPELSFTIRRLGCIAGINITASHNPKEYNGYKAYWSDGAQLPTEHSDKVSEMIAKIDVLEGARYISFRQGVESGLIKVIGADEDEAYMDYVISLIRDKDSIARSGISVAYTPFHGAGYKLLPEIFRRIGVEKLYCEPSQSIPDGDFPTVDSPNPQDIEGFSASVVLAVINNADIILGTDPDADRLAAVARDKFGEYKPVSGNQLGCLLLEHVINVLRERGLMPSDPVMIKSIVSTEMARVIAEKNGAKCANVFTGFKNIAEKIAEIECSSSGNVIFAFEESNGYLSGMECRDKDGLNAAALTVEMAARYKLRGMTLIDGIEELYEKYGHYREETLNFVMPGVDGLEDMRRIMAALHDAPPLAFGEYKVAKFTDYLAGTVKDIATGSVEKLDISGSDVLGFLTEEGDTFVIRPSGTEPKIRCYIMVSGRDAQHCAEKAAVFTDCARHLSV